MGIVPRRLKHGTREWQFTGEQIEAIKRHREETEEPSEAAG